jgi:PAS domain S-box-containing protein
MLFADVLGDGASGVIGGIIGVIGGSLIKPTYDFLLKKQQGDTSADQRARQEKTKNERDHITRLENRIATLEEREKVWMEKERQCQERVAALYEEVGELTGKLTSLEKLIERVESAQHVAIVVCDDQGVITAWNPAAAFFFHYSQQEAIGHNISMLVPPKLKGRHAKAFYEAVKSEGLVDSKREAYALTREGIEIPISISLTSFEEGGRRFFAAEIRRLQRG